MTASLSESDGTGEEREDKWTQHRHKWNGGHGSNKRGHARARCDAELILRTTQRQSAVMMGVCSRK